MIGIPFLARGFAMLLMFIGVCLACENTMISSEVFAKMSGGSILASVAIAVACTGLEMAAASWVMRGGSVEAVSKWIRHKPIATFSRMFFGGIVLGLIYHFDILTTYLHPDFNTENVYFFSVAVSAFVFGPEICLIIGWWLWLKASDEETKLLAKTNAKAAENAFWHADRKRSIALAVASGRERADRMARKRWNADE